MQSRDGPVRAGSAIAVFQRGRDLIRRSCGASFAATVRERLVTSTAFSLNSLDDVIRGTTICPEASAMFTTNLTSAETFLSHRDSDCGIANINIGTNCAEIGGEKDTGGGRESSSDAWRAYIRGQRNTPNCWRSVP
jgi:hypothetical protein